MALIQCNECGKEISDKAKSCPHCGSPVNELDNKKFCKHCGESIDRDCIICPKCGKQVEEINTNANNGNIVINNNNSASASATVVSPMIHGNPKNKWVAFALCFFLGMFGIHKFYEGKTGMGILYIFTGGLCGIGVIIDLIVILCKPNPYYI